MSKLRHGKLKDLSSSKCYYVKMWPHHDMTIFDFFYLFCDIMDISYEDAWILETPGGKKVDCSLHDFENMT